MNTTDLMESEEVARLDRDYRALLRRIVVFNKESDVLAEQVRRGEKTVDQLKKFINDFR